MKKVFIVGCAALLLSACTFGSGSHTGFITAVETNGVIWKNYKVYVKTDRSSSQEDVYCVDANDRELVSALQSAEQGKNQVTVHYDTNAYLFPLARCSGDTIKGVDVQK